MSSIYEELQGVASELLTTFDQKASGAISPTSNGMYYVAVTPGTGPAQNPGPSVEGTPIKLNAVARGVSFKYIDNKNIVVTDRQVTHAVNPAFVPDEKGFVLIDGVRHKVIAVRRKPEAGTPVAYTLIVRK